MPTYEYECTKGHHFETTQRITDPPLQRCEICRSKVRRLISATNFILKGGGWYGDGYSSPRSNGEKSSEKETSSTKSEDKGKSSSSKEK